MIEKLKSRDLWLGIVAGILVAIAASLGIDLNEEQVTTALDDAVEQLEPDADTDSE